METICSFNPPILEILKSDLPFELNLYSTGSELSLTVWSSKGLLILVPKNQRNKRTTIKGPDFVPDTHKWAIISNSTISIGRNMD